LQKKQIEEQKAEVKQTQEQQVRLRYIDNLNLFESNVLKGAGYSETLCSEAKSVWYNSIYKQRDINTDQYTVRDKDFNSFNDFDISLKNLYGDSVIQGMVNLIKNNQNDVADLYKLLQNPIDEFSICYEAVDNLYSIYYKFSDLAISPSGSLTTYSTNVNDYNTQISEGLNKLKMFIPEK